MRGARTGAYVALMTRLAFTDYLDHIVVGSARFRTVLADCDPAARVPACPDWDAGDLLWHLAEVQWFWSKNMARRPDAPDDSLVHPTRPPAYRDLLAAFDEYSAGLVAALRSADPAEPAWSWSAEQSVGFTFRRQAHEALIHRLDAEQTAGTVTALDPALALDGVAEALDVMYGGEAPAWGRIEPGEAHVRLDATDLGVSLWAQPCEFFGTDPDSGTNYDGPHVLRVDDPGTIVAAVIAGTAADLDAWLWKRRDATAVTMTGDRAALDAFLAAVRPPLD